MWVYLIILLMICVCIFFLEWKWHKEARKRVRVDIYRTSGNIDHVLAEDVGGVISVPKNGKDATKGGWVFNLAEVHTFTDIYPGKPLPAFMQTTIRTIGVNEWDTEPMAKKREVNVEFPSLLYNLENEKVTSLVVSVFDQVQELQEKLQKAITSYVNPKLVYGLLVVAVLAAGYCAYTVMEMQKEFELMQKAWGL